MVVMIPVFKASLCLVKLASDICDYGVFFFLQQNYKSVATSWCTENVGTARTSCKRERGERKKKINNKKKHRAIYLKADRKLKSPSFYHTQVTLFMLTRCLT